MNSLFLTGIFVLLFSSFHGQTVVKNETHDTPDVFAKSSRFLWYDFPLVPGDTDKIFVENYQKGIKTVNEFIGFMKEYNPHFTDHDKKIDELFHQFPAAGAFLEKAHKINPGDKNTIKALAVVARLMSDTAKHNYYVGLIDFSKDQK